MDKNSQSILTRFWPASEPLSGGDKLLGTAAGWAKFEVPTIRDLIFLGTRNLEVLYQNHLGASRDLRRQKKRLQETVERLKETSVSRLRARMSPFHFCDFAGEDYGKLTPEEAGNLSMEELQEQQSRAARRVRRGCRFGPFVSGWCPKAPACNTVKHAENNKGCETCGRCGSQPQPPVCIFAATFSREALKDCIHDLEVDLATYEMALLKLDIYLKNLRIARKKAEVKPVFVSWRKLGYAKIGDSVAIVEQAEQPQWQFDMATVMAYGNAIRNVTTGLRTAVLAQTSKGQELRISHDSPCLLTEVDLNYLRKHPDFARFWAMAAGNA